MNCRIVIGWEVSRFSGSRFSGDDEPTVPSWVKPREIYTVPLSNESSAVVTGIQVPVGPISDCEEFETNCAPFWHNYQTDIDKMREAISRATKQDPGVPKIWVTCSS